MTQDPFEDDPAWVRYKCMELAKDITKSRNPEKIVEAAKILNNYIAPLPKCKLVKMKKHR